MLMTTKTATTIPMTAKMDRFLTARPSSLRGIEETAVLGEWLLCGKLLLLQWIVGPYGPSEWGTLGMKAIVERLSGELSNRYLHYIESLMVDLWSENGQIEFRCGFALRADHELRTLTITVDATAGTNDAERELIVGAVFKRLEQTIDEAIAELDADRKQRR